jgi:hypothetical protein
MAKGGFEASKIIMMQNVGEDSSLAVHLIASTSGLAIASPKISRIWSSNTLPPIIIMYTPLDYFLPFLGVELALKGSLKKLLEDLMAVHFKLLCLRPHGGHSPKKNWANRTLNLGLSKRRRI